MIICRTTTYPDLTAEIVNSRHNRDGLVFDVERLDGRDWTVTEATLDGWTQYTCHTLSVRRTEIAEVAQIDALTDADELIYHPLPSLCAAAVC